MKHAQTRQRAIPLAEAIRPTTVIECRRLDCKLGAKVTIASETFQHTGSFKFRAAYNLASNVPQQKIIGASSGNFGQALAYACQLLDKTCIVVMPNTSAKVKIDSVKNFGGLVDLVDVTKTSRGKRLEELGKEHPDAYLASAFDDQFVIEGNASLGQEICALEQQFDFVAVPVGGGGLSSGIVQAIHASGKNIKVVGAEPLIANDAARSLKQGKIVRNEQEPQTLADGARTLSLGKLNWEILSSGLDSIIEVPEEKIKEAVQILFSLANLKVEPTGALSVGALLTKPERFHGKHVCCVVTGGNVDPKIYAELISPDR